MNKPHDEDFAKAALAFVAGLAFVALVVWLGVQAYIAPSMTGHIGYGFGAVAVCGAVEACFQAAWEIARRPKETALPGPNAV